MDVLAKFSTPGILFLLTLASGLWLSNSGKPLNSIIFNIHKLIALGVVITIIIQMYNLLKITDVRFLILLLIVFSGLCVVALFATGALMSLGKMNYTVLLNIHRVAPVLAIISMAATIYLLAG